MTEGGTARYGKACGRLRTRRRVEKGERAFRSNKIYVFFFVNNLHNKYLKDLCPHSRKRAGFVFFSPPHTVRVCFLRLVPRLSLSKPQLRNFLSVFLCILSNSPHIFLFQINQGPCQAARFHHYSNSLSLARACALSFFLSLSLSLFMANLYKYI